MSKQNDHFFYLAITMTVAIVAIFGVFALSSSSSTATSATPTSTYVPAENLVGGAISTTSTANWQATIRATVYTSSQSYDVASNSMGVAAGQHQSASDGYDSYDRFAPPPPPSNAAYHYMIMQQGVFAGERFLHDIRSTQANQVWEMHVDYPSSSQNTVVLLSWDQRGVPSNVYLRALTGSSTNDMEAQMSSTSNMWVIMPPRTNKARFQIVREAQFTNEEFTNQPVLYPTHDPSRTWDEGGSDDGFRTTFR